MMNANFVESLSMIGAITSRGDWFFSKLTKNNNSKVFVEFMKELFNWLTDKLRVSLSQIVFIIDNHPAHCSRYN